MLSRFFIVKSQFQFHEIKFHASTSINVFHKIDNKNGMKIQLCPSNKQKCVCIYILIRYLV
jgi:hypothetical protein